MTPPGPKALVPFVSVEAMMRLIHRIGLPAMLAGIAAEIELDFRRWEAFDKTPRIPAHHPNGVIELMPTTDGETYGFKYVNGHPRNMKAGLPDRHRLRPAGRHGHRLSGAAVGDDDPDGAADGGDVGGGGAPPRPEGRTVMAVIGNGAQCEFQCAGLPASLRHHGGPAVGHRPEGDREVGAEPARAAA